MTVITGGRARCNSSKGEERSGSGPCWQGGGDVTGWRCFFLFIVELLLILVVASERCCVLTLMHRLSMVAIDAIKHVTCIYLCKPLSN
jgi:hypothetical protein